MGDPRRPSGRRRRAGPQGRPLSPRPPRMVRRTRGPGYPSVKAKGSPRAPASGRSPAGRVAVRAKAGRTRDRIVKGASEAHRTAGAPNAGLPRAPGLVPRRSGEGVPVALAGTHCFAPPCGRCLHAIERGAREVLFTVTARDRYEAKAFIEAVAYRGGDDRSALVQGRLLAAGVGLPVSVLLALPVALGWLALALYLARGHAALVRP